MASLKKHRPLQTTVATTITTAATTVAVTLIITATFRLQIYRICQYLSLILLKRVTRKGVVKKLLHLALML